MASLLIALCAAAYICSQLHLDPNTDWDNLDYDIDPREDWYTDNTTYHTRCSRDVRQGRKVKVTGRWRGYGRSTSPSHLFDHLPKERDKKVLKRMYRLNRSRRERWGGAYVYRPTHKTWTVTVYVYDINYEIVGTKTEEHWMEIGLVPLMNKEGVCVRWVWKDEGVSRHR